MGRQLLARGGRAARPGAARRGGAARGRRGDRRAAPPAQARRPSGTALALARAVEAARGPLQRVHGREGDVGARTSDTLGIHAVRGGDVVGEHTVWLLGAGSGSR
ncbi:MAG: dihydrodipicolinate reductase C-terminal domain-containing protein [Myxococcota bacterium]